MALDSPFIYFKLAQGITLEKAAQEIPELATAEICVSPNVYQLRTASRAATLLALTPEPEDPRFKEQVIVQTELRLRDIKL